MNDLKIDNLPVLSEVFIIKQHEIVKGVPVSYIKTSTPNHYDVTLSVDGTSLIKTFYYEGTWKCLDKNICTHVLDLKDKIFIKSPYKVGLSSETIKNIKYDRFVSKYGNEYPELYLQGI